MAVIIQRQSAALFPALLASHIPYEEEVLHYYSVRREERIAGSSTRFFRRHVYRPISFKYMRIHFARSRRTHLEDVQNDADTEPRIASLLIAWKSIFRLITIHRSMLSKKVFRIELSNCIYHADGYGRCERRSEERVPYRANFLDINHSQNLLHHIHF